MKPAACAVLLAALMAGCSNIPDLKPWSFTKQDEQPPTVEDINRNQGLALLYDLLNSESQVAQIFTTIAAFGTCFVFFSSSVYHSTAPDATLAYFTRFLDFFAIYLGIVLTATADIAVATRGFANVPVVTIIDLPIAGAVVVVFFLWRRHRVNKEETWLDVSFATSNEQGCIISHGLFSRGHHDLHHSQLRETTSLLLPPAGRESSSGKPSGRSAQRARSPTTASPSAILLSVPVFCLLPPSKNGCFLGKIF